MTSFILAMSLFGMQSSATVRIINAVVDTEWASFSIADSNWGSVPYGQRTPYYSTPAGNVQTLVVGRRGEKISNEVQVRFQPGYPHTLIYCGFPTGTGNFTPIVIRDSTAGKPANSSVQFQFINANSDKESMTVLLNGKKVQQATHLKFGDSTSFIGYDPREYAVEIQSPNGASVWKTNFKAIGGNRYTAVIIGSKTLQGTKAPRVYFYSF